MKSCRDRVRRLSSLPGLLCWVRSVFPPLKRWAIVGCPWRDKTQCVAFAGRAQWGVSLRFVPPGTVENSPPFQRWVRMHAIPKVPPGTKDIGPVGDQHDGIERIRIHANDVNSCRRWFQTSIVPAGTFVLGSIRFPTVETVGYCRVSLAGRNAIGCPWRDKRNAVPLRDKTRMTYFPVRPPEFSSLSAS